MELNSLCPYELVKEDEWNYSFVTKHGIVYHAYFIDFSNYHPAFGNVYTFNIEPESDVPHPIDNRISQTITEILKHFFIVKENAMIMVCDNMDGKEEKREQLFARWFVRHNDGSIVKFDASVSDEDYLLYVSIYLRKDNPQLQTLVPAFYDLVKNGFYPID